MEIGKQIKKYRQKIGITQEELADKIFVSRQTISNWENNKNYPDIKSLLFLSSLFRVSLDILIKGDIKEMKEKINTDDVNEFKYKSNIFAIFMLFVILLPIPLFKFGGYIGVGIWILIFIITIYYAIQIEKLKKNFDIQTYKEILAFTEGKNINEIEKHYEHGKRTYQKFLLALGTGVITLVITVIMFYVI
jgi:transcriptional regulator with XRE-family HTH domain